MTKPDRLDSVFVAEAVRTVKGFGGVAVVDETHSGLGRTGVSGPSGSPSPTAGGGLWAFQRYCGNDRSLVPDIVTGKYKKDKKSRKFRKC